MPHGNEGLEGPLGEQQQKSVVDFNEDKIKETEKFLDLMHTDLRQIFGAAYMPLQLKLFIFKCRVKEIFLYSDLSFIKALQETLNKIYEI